MTDRCVKRPKRRWKGIEPTRRSSDERQGPISPPPSRAREVAARCEAGKLVDDADALVHEVLSTGRWPQQKTVDRLLKGDRLERVLSLYERAMRLDPGEPAYPWNLASTLDRLGLSDLALGYMVRAIQVAEETGDDEWAGADAHVALAEIALRTGETDLALTALASALIRSLRTPGFEGRRARCSKGSARRPECLDRTWRSRRGSSGFRPEPREPEREHRGLRGPC
jgi:tetratricopeptide (TPR) repeat protein